MSALPEGVAESFVLNVPKPGDHIAAFFDDFDLILQHDYLLQVLTDESHALPPPKYPADFFTDALPKMVKAVLATNEWTVELYDRAYSFLNQVLDLFVVFLDQYPKECRDLLVLIFDKEQYYYFRSRVDHHLKPWIKKVVEGSNHGAAPGQPAYAKPEYRQPVMYLTEIPPNHVMVAHLNSFGARGGFNKLLAQEAHWNLDVISQLTSIFYPLSELFGYDSPLREKNRAVCASERSGPHGAAQLLRSGPQNTRQTEN